MKEPFVTMLIIAVLVNNYHITFEQYWQDDYLQWNTSDYGGLTQIVLSPELVWLPDFGIENR